MKIFFRVFLLSLLAFALLNAGESSAEKIFPDYQSGQANWIDDVGSILQNEIMDLMKKIYDNVSKILHNKVVYTIFATAIMLWALNQLKNGYPTRDEMWKFGKMVVLCSFILGIFSSYDIFVGFLQYATIPASWVVSALDGVFSSGGAGKSISEIAISLFNDVGKICSIGWEKTCEYYFKLNEGWFSLDAIAMLKAYYQTAIWMFPTWLMAIVFFILGMLFVAIIMFSSFMATLLLCFAPIVVPFLGLPFLKQYFYSWLKLWITYTLIAPIAMLVISLSTKSITEIASKDATSIGNISINGEQWATYTSPIVIAIMCLFILRKIPTWITQILGVQGVESSGLGIGAASATAIGSAAGAGVMAKATGQGGFMSNFAKNLPGMPMTRALGALGTQALGNTGGAVGAGMQSVGGIAQALSGGSGIMASAGKTFTQMGGATRDISRSMRRSAERQKTSLAKDIDIDKNK